MELLWLPAVLGLGYAALCGYTLLVQDKMLYFPDPNQPNPAQISSTGLEPWPAGSAVFRGYLGLREKKTEAGTVVVFHGNAGAAWQRHYYLDYLEPLGFRVILAEYPGYGGRPGRLGEKSFVADAKETLGLAYSQFGGPVYLLGESLGAGVVSAVAADSAVPIAGLILITPWDALTDVAARHYWYLPVRLLARDRYDNVRNLADYSGSVAVLLAEYDEIVPANHGARLFESLKGRKKSWQIKGASHNSWTYFLTSELWSEIMDFIKGTMPDQEHLPKQAVSGETSPD